MNKNMLFINLLCISGSIYSFINGMMPNPNDVKIIASLQLDTTKDMEFHATGKKKIEALVPVKLQKWSIVDKTTGNRTPKQVPFFWPSHLPHSLLKSSSTTIQGETQVGDLYDDSDDLFVGRITGTFTQNKQFVKKIAYDGTIAHYDQNSCVFIPTTITLAKNPETKEPFHHGLEKMVKTFEDKPNHSIASLPFCDHATALQSATEQGLLERIQSQYRIGNAFLKKELNRRYGNPVKMINNRQIYGTKNLQQKQRLQTNATLTHEHQQVENHRPAKKRRLENSHTTTE